MPHGMPDWGLMGPKTVTYGLDDMGELAVRLGSPHLWDRRGDALHMTDFREGLGIFRWGVSGAGAEVALCTGHSRSGAYSVRLRAGSNLDRLAYLRARFSVQEPSCVGQEFTFALGDTTTELHGEIDWFDGVFAHYGRVRYSVALGQLHYYTTGAAWVLLQGGVFINFADRPEHTLKVVVDMDLNEYVRVRLDHQAWDVRGVPVNEEVAPIPEAWQFTIRHYGLGGWNPDSYIDDVIITQNEPR